MEQNQKKEQRKVLRHSSGSEGNSLFFPGGQLHKLHVVKPYFPCYIAQHIVMVGLASGPRLFGGGGKGVLPAAPGNGTENSGRGEITYHAVAVVDADVESACLRPFAGKEFYIFLTDEKAQTVGGVGLEGFHTVDHR